MQQIESRSFYEHNKIEKPQKASDDKLADFKRELKEWAQIDLDSLMFHMISLEEKTLPAIKGALPEILQKIETEALEQKETI